MTELLKLLLLLFVLLGLSGCSFQDNNALKLSVGVNEQHQIEFKAKGGVDMVAVADPWVVVEWVEDSVNGVVGMIVPGWTGFGGLFE